MDLFCIRKIHWQPFCFLKNTDHFVTPNFSRTHHDSVIIRGLELFTSRIIYGTVFLFLPPIPQWQVVAICHCSKLLFFTSGSGLTFWESESASFDQSWEDRIELILFLQKQNHLNKLVAMHVSFYISSNCMLWLKGTK